MKTKTGKRKLKKNIKYFLSLMFGAFMFISATIMVYAYLSASSGQLSNSFTVDSNPETEIDEGFESKIIKTDVSVSNKSEYSVYVRAAILVNWKDDASNKVYAINPVVGEDYWMDLQVGDAGSWILGSDGFYYYKYPVNSGGNTDVLIKECYQICEAPNGYNLHVEIIAQTIQALGTTDDDENVYAVEDAWGVILNDAQEISGFKDSQ